MFVRVMGSTKEGDLMTTVVGHRATGGDCGDGGGEDGENE